MFDLLVVSSISSTVMVVWMSILMRAAVLDGRSDDSHHLMT
jgi:hypothetical protein